ncbi:SDR family NAD(P)-dependent oxidoreductase [Humibacter albus]|jgi:NAD(P)-dependent dehydrogenase (short-subunit alcohol dehydrogenase family)|uniref:SDR family NAD(P)-dependent oxidoreductase n=1 Tax=Humibacter albus TaxID=427754 RepID=UPI0003B39085|nr:glucose 1-dehydrogenase [Humibacter albus]
MSGFAGKAALVTGAGRGIGRAIACGLARLDADVAVLDLDQAAAEQTAAAIRESGGNAIGVHVDVADEQSVAIAVAAVAKAFERLDVAVNNAGIPSTGEDLAEMSAQSWEHVLRVNLTGTFLSLKHEIPELLRAGGGAIVNIASNGGLRAIPQAPAYVASKHGVVGLTKVAAVDYARRGIRVNAVAPAITRTAMFDRVAGDTDMAARQEAITPLGRLATPEEVAAVAIWLCSADASYITGTTVSVDGGRQA